MTFSTRKLTTLAPVAFASLAVLAACGKTSSSSDSKQPETAAVQKPSTNPDIKADSLSPSGTNNSVTVTGNPVIPNGGIIQNPSQNPGQNPSQMPSQSPVQVGGNPGQQVPGAGSSAGPIIWIAPGVKPGSSVVQGTQTYQVVGLRFPKKIVALPLEFIDLKTNERADAQPVLTSAITLRGKFVPAGTHVKGTLQALSGGSSTFQAEWLQLNNDESLALQGGGYIATEDSTMTSANGAAIAGGALVGGGIAALVDHFVGSSGVNGWAVSIGAVAGGIIGWQFFPESQNVIVIQKDELANVGLN